MPTELLQFISDHLIKGIFASAILIIVARSLFRSWLETKYAIQIVRWVIIMYTILNLVRIVFSLINAGSQSHIFFERLTGNYWWAYWLMLITAYIIPFTLLNKNSGRKIFYVLLVALLMNIGWLFESFVIHITSIHRDFSDKNYNPYLPNKNEISILADGFITGTLVLLIGNSIKKWRTTEIKT